MQYEIKIPDFAAKDFKNTDAPYQWLYQYKGDELLHKQLLAEISAQAKKLGVTGATSLYKAFCSMKSRQAKNNYTNFEGQELKLFCGEYQCSEDGVTLTTKAGIEIKVSYQPLIVTKIITNIDDGKTRLELCYKAKNKWKKMCILKSVIASTATIISLADYDIFVNSENARALSNYIFYLERNNLNIIPQVYSVSHLGWTDNDYAEFAPYSSNLIFDGEQNQQKMFNSVKSKGNYETWLEAIKKVRSEKTVARLFLAASFAAPIIKPLHLLSFIVHIWGNSGYGKTVALMLAASVWANPSMGEYITTFNSTAVGQEMVATLLNNMPVCLDELQISSTAGLANFDNIIYKLCEGVGKTRGAVQGGTRPQNRWHTCFVTTGEAPITHSQSANGAVFRVLEVECKHKIYSDLLGLCKVLNQNYGFAGQKFIEYISDEKNLQKISDLQQDYYKQFLELNVVEKPAASAALLLAVDKTITEIFFENDGNELQIADIEEICVKNSEMSSYDKALEYLYQAVARNPMHFEVNDYGEYRAEVWGSTDEEYIYIIKSVFDEILQKFNYNPVAFLSWAKERDLIKCNPQRRTLQKRINKSLTTVVALKKPNDFEDFAEIDENKELPF